MLTRNNGMHPRHSAMGIENRPSANDFDGIRANIRRLDNVCRRYLAEPDRAAEDRRPAMMSSRAARYTKTAFPDAGKAVDFKAAAAGYPSTNVGEGAAACQAAMRCSSAGASNCSSSVEPDRAVIELLPPVTA